MLSLQRGKFKVFYNTKPTSIAVGLFFIRSKSGDFAQRENFDYY